MIKFFLVLFVPFIFIEKAHNYSLLFPTKNISNYVVLNVNLKAMDTFTACLWVKTLAGGMQTLFSYETALYLQCSDTGECVMGNEQQQRFVTCYFKFFFSKPIILSFRGANVWKRGEERIKPSYIHRFIFTLPDVLRTNLMTSSHLTG